MKLKLEKREWLYAGVFTLLFAFLCWRLYPIMFAVHDDMYMYTISREGHVFATGFAHAKAGRIAQLWNYPLLVLPFLADSVWFYKLLSYACTLFDLWALFVLLDRHVSRDAAWLTVISCTAFATISMHHNLFISYAVCHQLPAGLFFLALHCFLTYLHSARRRDMVLCCVLYLISCMIYETFLMDMLVLLAAAIWVKSRENKGFWRFCRDVLGAVLPPLICALCYVAVYKLWQLKYPSSYTGTSLYLDEPFYSLRILWEFSLSLLPFHANAATDYALSPEELLHTLTPVRAVKALLVTAVFVLTVKRASHGAKHRGMLLVMTAAVFAPNILIAFSQKYVESAKRNIITYIPSFYSFLAAAAVLCIGCAAVYRLIGRGNLRVLFLAGTGAVVCIASLLSDYNIGYWQAYYKKLDQRYANFAHAVASPAVTQCDSTWEIYAPDSSGIHYNEPYTLRFLALYDDTPAGGFVLTADAIDHSRSVLCLRADAEYRVMTAARVDSLLRADELTVLTTMPGTFDVTVRLRSGEELTFPDVSDGSVITAPEDTPFDMRARCSVRLK